MRTKIIVLCAVCCSLIWGCASRGPEVDDFELFHAKVERALSGKCICDYLSAGDHSVFVVRAPGSRPLITVSRSRYYTQDEWERKYVAQYVDQKTGLPLAATTNYVALPQGKYRHIGVHVRIEDVDFSYPGLERDQAEAKVYYQKIIDLLTLYSVPKR